jgi:molybdate transport system ATP-binding protein
MIDVDVEQRLGAFDLRVRFSAHAPIVGLFGASGAGKSSVVNAIAGTTKPSRGSIRVDGRQLFDSARGVNLPPDARRIGYVFQDALLFPHLDVNANLRYGHRLRRPAERFIDDSKVIELLGLRALLQRRPATLSGGERQRVAIGRALLAQPRILLLDEPLAALDVPRKGEILDYIERLRDELRIPMVYVSHAVPEITRLADTVVVLDEGKCVAVGAVAEVMGRFDLAPLTGLHESASVIDTRVARHDASEQLTTLAFPGGELVVPLLHAAIGERVRAGIRSRDVSLSLQRPAAISILNVLPARVRAIGAQAGPSVDVQLALGVASLTARITGHSLRELGIREGQALYALVKAVSLDSPSVGYA